MILVKSLQRLLMIMIFNSDPLSQKMYMHFVYFFCQCPLILVNLFYFDIPSWHSTLFSPSS